MAKTVKNNLPVDTVNAETVEASIKAKEIGARIRRLRLKRSMGLVELGQKVGLSASFLSQLETGRVIPTVRNLARIAMAFKKDFTYFLAEEETQELFRISRAKDRIRILMGEKEATIVVADNMGLLLQDPKTVPFVAEFQPGIEGTAFQPKIFAGLELVYVIDGLLEVATESKTELLRPEDSAWIDSNTQRRYRCHDDKPARAVIVFFAVHA